VERKGQEITIQNTFATIQNILIRKANKILSSQYLAFKMD